MGISQGAASLIKKLFTFANVANLKKKAEDELLTEKGGTEGQLLRWRDGCLRRIYICGGNTNRETSALASVISSIC